MTVSAYLGEKAFQESSCRVEGDLYRHLFRSRRLPQGAMIRAVNGKGEARSARVERVERDHAILALGEALDPWNPSIEIDLFVSPLRPERNVWLVEKATELGIRRIQWIQTERSHRSIREQDRARLKRVSIAALNQCGGARLPELDPVLDWQAAMKAAQSSEVRVTIDFSGERPESIEASSLALFVGPEGGWTDGEREDLRRRTDVFWNLGDRILRSETAAIASAAVLLFH